MDDIPYIAQFSRSKANLHEEALRLQTRRFEVLAGNIANADTPGYKARDVDFGAELERVLGATTGPGLTMTSSRHIDTQTPRHDPDLLYRAPMQSSIDGNTVEMESERVAFSENKVRMEFSIQKAASKYQNMMRMYRDMRD